jgi:hypothetical protein
LTEFSPDEQEQHICLPGGKIGKCLGQQATHPLGIDPRLDPVDPDDGVRRQRRDRRQLADLAPSVVAEKVGDYAEEPGAGIASPGIEAGTPIEGDEEGLGGELVSQLTVKPAAQIAVDRPEMPLEDETEGRRVRE